MVFKKLLSLLTPPERKRLGLLLGMILVMAFLDVLGVASILPFIAVLSNPELVQTNTLLNTAFSISHYIGIYTTEQFLFALGVSVFVLLVSSLAFRSLTTYAQIRFVLMREYSISKRLLEGYLHQPYSWFLSRHSADLGKTILSEVSLVVNGGITPFLTLTTQSTVSLAIVILLIIVDPLLALSVGVVLGLFYASIYAITSNLLNRLGQARHVANKERYTAVSEAFGAAKEMKVSRLEQTYIQRFAKPAEIYAKGQATAAVIAQIPRFALEAIAFGGMLLIILYLMLRGGSFTSSLPIITLYAFASYRLMPSLQQIYAAFAQLRFAGPAVNSLHQDLMNLQVYEVQQDVISPLSLTQAITLSQVSYRYPNAPQSAIKGIDISIPAHSSVGFIGATGSGKSTAVDVILGLLEPQKGSLNVDGQPITAANLRKWQKTIGYVPQQIFLADDSVAANIAFGEKVNNIDQVALERAAKMAKLHEFLINDLPQGYNTVIGERGVRLSGGQRQRIGIARALYHKPKVIILDEATSALDNFTEKAVMDEVIKLGHDVTVIIIAHRLSTIRHCDQLYLFDKGKLKASGTYQELFIASEHFRQLVEIDYD